MRCPRARGAALCMSFSFNFSANDASEASTPAEPELELRPATEHSIAEVNPDAADWPVEEVPVPGDKHSKTLRKRALPESRLSQLLEAEACPASASGDMDNSDLLTNVYEGGFKLWECARDLLQVVSESSARGELELQGAAVLEAGCGAGLPGLLAMQLGAARLVLQDFNPGVLRAVTMPAVQLNGLLARAQAADVRFIGGDWSCVGEKLARECADANGSGSQLQGLFEDAPKATPGFDLILTADTIYNVEATPRLWKLIAEQLRPGGVALVAAKSYYFGVGGSIAAFSALVAADTRFECSSIATFEDGRSNRREVLRVRWATERRAPASESVASEESAGGLKRERAATSILDAKCPRAEAARESQ